MVYCPICSVYVEGRKAKHKHFTSKEHYDRMARRYIRAYKEKGPRHR